MNETVTLSSGKVLEMQMPPFALANNLKRTVARELLAVDANLDLKALDPESEVSQLPGNVLNTLKNALFVVIASDAVDRLLMDCMCAGSLYDGAKITLKSFDGEEARSDFQECAWEVMKFTLRPFTGAFGSMLKKYLPKKPDSQKL